MSPFTKLARSRAVELISSCALEMFSFESSSSITLSDLEFSDLEAEEDMAAAAGAICRRRGVGSGVVGILYWRERGVWKRMG